MEYLLSQAETILLAKAMVAKGKSAFFIAETLERRGAHPEHISLALEEIIDEIGSKAQRVLKWGLAFVVLGGSWTLLAFGLDLLAALESHLSHAGAFMVLYAPLAVGLLCTYKGIYKISKFS